MKRCCFLLGVIALGLSLSWKAQAAPSSSGPIPNSELPTHIKLPVDSVTLFSDFEHPGPDGIPLYFINGKQADQTLSFQDSDFYIKLEYQDEAGKWVRAQKHQFSDCGNSYGGALVPPGMHYKFSGYTPRDGKTAKVRYKMYSHPWVVSNEGIGVVSMSEVVLAAKDELAVRFLPGIFADAFNEHSRELTPPQRVSALELLELYGKATHVRESAKALADHWKQTQESTVEQKRAAEDIHRLLSKPEPEDQSLDRLVRACWERINRKSSGLNESLVPWLVCGQLSQKFFSEGRGEPTESGMLSDLATWAALTRHAAGLHQNADEATRNLIELLLKSDFLVDSFLTREDLVKLLNTTEDATYIASCAFARRNEWEWLAEQAMGFRAEFKPKVLLALASRGRNAEIMRSRGRWIPSLPPKDSAQEKLWKDVSESDPAMVAFLFYYWAQDSAGGTINFGPIIVAALRRHLRKEKARIEEYVMPPLDVTQYELRYLSLANDAQDTPLFQELLSHGGYVTSATTSYGPGNEKREYTSLQYGIRHVAAEILEARGVKVPPDLVISKEISDSGTKVLTFSECRRR